MKKFGFVASGGGYRSFYSCGALVWLKTHGFPIVHITSTSSGNNIVLDYLMWNPDKEELPPILTRTIRLSLKDIFHVFSNFLGLKPPLLPNGSYLFNIDKDRCRKSLLLDETSRRELLSTHLASVQWDIIATNLTKRKSEYFRVNKILSELNDTSLSRFMEVFLAGITTIPYFRAPMINDQYYLEGGYLDNTPLRPLFEDPQVDEIIAIDFTDYDYHAEIAKVYDSTTFTLPLNSIEMHLLVSDMELTLPNIGILSQAVRINKLLQAVGKTSLEIDGKVYHYKPLHILKPKNLESMTISLKDSTIQKKYFELGEQETETLFD